MSRPRGLPKSGGRKPGSRNMDKRAREQAIVRTILAERLTPDELEQLSPLAVLLRLMRTAYQDDDRSGALAAAQAAAPYVHARLSSTEITVRNEDLGKSDAQIEQEIRELQAKLSASGIWQVN